MRKNVITVQLKGEDHFSWNKSGHSCFYVLVF